MVFRNPDNLLVDIADAPDLTTTLKDSTVFWANSKAKPVPLKVNLMTRARNKLMRIAWRIMHELFSSEPTTLERVALARGLIETLQDWHKSLPRELQYSVEMSTGLFELQYDT